MNVPKLRFSEFNDKWKIEKFYNYATKITDKNKNLIIKNVISNSALYGLISQREFFDKDIANNDNLSSYYIINHNNFVYNPRKSNEAPYGPINRYTQLEEGVISPLYLCFSIKGINEIFLEKYFKSNKWYRYIYLNGDSGARADRVSIKDELFFNQPISIPSIKEQEKIGNMLSLLDKKIELQAKKIEDLKLYKKGLILTIKKDNSTWTNIKISDIFNITRGVVIPRTELSDVKDAKNKYPVYSSQTSNDGILGYSNTYDFDGKYLTWTTDGANAGKVFYRNGKFRCTNVCGVLYENNIKYTSELFAELLNYETPKHVSYVGNPKLMNNVIADIKINIPSIEFQNKVSNFISAINTKIKYENKKLSKIEQLKKGLMQNMFI